MNLKRTSRIDAMEFNYFAFPTTRHTMLTSMPIYVNLPTASFPMASLSGVTMSQQISPEEMEEIREGFQKVGE